MEQFNSGSVVVVGGIVVLIGLVLCVVFVVDVFGDSEVVTGPFVVDVVVERTYKKT